jgi:hypothetical protein
MSLVGPRPERPHFVEQFKDGVGHYMTRHVSRPGMTGWAQVNGLRGDTSIEDRVQHDLYYLENWSLSFDLKILIQTFFNRQDASERPMAKPPLKTCVLIPAYNEAKRVGAVVREVLDYCPDVVVIDDGSPATPTARPPRPARRARARAQPGQGRRLQTGFDYARANGYDLAITMDADGQHAPSDIPAFLQAYERTHRPVLVGNRMGNVGDMPWNRRLVNRFMSDLRFPRHGPVRFPTASAASASTTVPRSPKALRRPFPAFSPPNRNSSATFLQGRKSAAVAIQTIYGDEKSKVNPFSTHPLLPHAAPLPPDQKGTPRPIETPLRLACALLPGLAFALPEPRTRHPERNPWFWNAPAPIPPSKLPHESTGRSSPTPCAKKAFPSMPPSSPFPRCHSSSSAAPSPPATCSCRTRTNPPGSAATTDAAPRASSLGRARQHAARSLHPPAAGPRLEALHESFPPARNSSTGSSRDTRRKTADIREIRNPRPDRLRRHPPCRPPARGPAPWPAGLLGMSFAHCAAVHLPRRAYRRRRHDESWRLGWIGATVAGVVLLALFLGALARAPCAPNPPPDFLAPPVVLSGDVNIIRVRIPVRRVSAGVRWTRHLPERCSHFSRCDSRSFPQSGRDGRLRESVPAFATARRHFVVSRFPKGGRTGQEIWDPPRLAADRILFLVA